MKVKICGLRRLCDIQTVNKYRPEYIGFVFAESKRKVTPSQAMDMRKALSQDIIPVGVFVNETINNIVSLARNGIIEAVQLHGDETEEYIEKLKMLADKPVIKAVPVQQHGDVQKWDDTCADYLLLDNKGGGTGQSFNWSLTGKTRKPYFLAGGLNVFNIEEAIRQTGPFAVDISSGVETDGSKDSEKIGTIIRRIRNG